MTPHVLMFCPQFYPLIGGAEEQAQKLALTLLQQGCQVEILTPQHKKSWSTQETIKGLTVHRFPFVDLQSRFMRFRGLGVPNTLMLGAQVKHAVSRYSQGFDIVHTHIASPMVAFAMEAAQRQGKKVICKICSGGKTFDLTEIRKTSWLGPGLERKLVTSMQRWVAISLEIRSDLIKAGVSPHQIVSIPNGVSIPNSPEKTKVERARRFLYLGRFTLERDLETMLRAFDVVVKEFPDCEMKLVGGGKREDEIRRILTSLPHASSRTELVGFSDPKPWLEWADALVHPSFVDGMSNALLEGMAYRLSCIANDIPPNREVLGEGEAGILVPTKNVDALAQTMRSLVAVSGECEYWQKRARERAEKIYSIDRIAHEYLQLYKEILKA